MNNSRQNDNQPNVPLCSDLGVIHTSELIQLADGDPCRHHNIDSRGGSHNKPQEGILNGAGQAIKNTAEKVADKAGELKDMAKEKIQDGVDVITGN